MVLLVREVLAGVGLVAQVLGGYIWRRVPCLAGPRG